MTRTINIHPYHIYSAPGLQSDDHHDLILKVEAHRLDYADGDIIGALSPKTAEQGCCDKPVEIAGHLFAITGTLGSSMGSDYAQARAYELIPIVAFTGEIVTYRQRLQEHLHDISRPINYGGVLIGCPSGEFVLGRRVSIMAFDDQP